MSSSCYGCGLRTAVPRWCTWKLRFGDFGHTSWFCLDSSGLCRFCRHYFLNTKRRYPALLSLNLVKRNILFIYQNKSVKGRFSLAYLLTHLPPNNWLRNKVPYPQPITLMFFKVTIYLQSGNFYQINIFAIIVMVEVWSLILKKVYKKKKILVKRQAVLFADAGSSLRTTKTKTPRLSFRSTKYSRRKLFIDRTQE